MCVCVCGWCWVWWLTSIISALGKLRQEYYSKVEASLGNRDGGWGWVAWADIKSKTKIKSSPKNQNVYVYMYICGLLKLRTLKQLRTT